MAFYITLKCQVNQHCHLFPPLTWGNRHQLRDVIKSESSSSAIMRAQHRTPQTAVNIRARRLTLSEVRGLGRSWPRIDGVKRRRTMKRAGRPAPASVVCPLVCRDLATEGAGDARSALQSRGEQRSLGLNLYPVWTSYRAESFSPSPSL
ncbi:hypothetical protein RRG08_063865 [Elysia crispata]|uniref:Uncharacterized protein n=1 Tax=Elysia crispata TaxID=231223 RepID=A0AAE1AD68_9GAST|nr:hypothetical protein RRG08_063865 [Elysia crispata]